MLRSSPEERSSKQRRGVSLKSGKSEKVWDQLFYYKE
jgi:hypothetical protein